MLTRFRMDVVCRTTREAVGYAGGLICDRSLTGWDVSIFALRDDNDAGSDLALRTIGASRAERLSQEPAADELLRAVVVSGRLYRDDDAVRRWVWEAMREPLIEVLVWDAGLPVSDVRYAEIPVSRAAAVFRDHAAAAVELELVVTNSELFCQLRTGRIRRAQRQHVLTTVNGV